MTPLWKLYKYLPKRASTPMLRCRDEELELTPDKSLTRRSDLRVFGLRPRQRLQIVTRAWDHESLSEQSWCLAYKPAARHPSKCGSYPEKGKTFPIELPRPRGFLEAEMIISAAKKLVGKAVMTVSPLGKSV